MEVLWKTYINIIQNLNLLKLLKWQEIICKFKFTDFNLKTLLKILFKGNCNTILEEWIKMYLNVLWGLLKWT